MAAHAIQTVFTNGVVCAEQCLQPVHASADTYDVIALGRELKYRRLG
jgi:hypothetical protein